MATRAATDEASPFVFYDWQYAILFGPLALGFLSSIFGGNLRQSGNHVRVRPPPWVFFVVWTMLYTLLGVAWAMNISYWNETKLQNVNLWTAYGINLTGNEMFIMCMCFYSFLMFCLFIWPIVYNRAPGPMPAVYVLGLALAFSYVLLAVNPRISNICIAPLIAWLGFAMLLEYHDANYKLRMAAKHHHHM